MIIGRNGELEALERQCARGSFEFACLYGRRRVGITGLVLEFIENKRAVFFSPRETNGRENLEFLNAAIHTAFDVPEARGNAPVKAPAFHTYGEALDWVFAAAEGSRLIFVIDDYQRLVDSCSGIGEALGERIGGRSENCALFLILTGSPAFMEKEALGNSGPLFGKTTSRYKIDGFDFFTALKFLPNRSPLDALAVYAMTGGVPSYLIRFAGKGPLKEKITAGFLNPQGFFFEEPGKLLKQELREMGNYNALLRGIATGAERISGLAYKTGLETGLISHLLKVLLKMGIVERETPVYETDQAGKKPVYAITDNLFAFWYRFIPPLLELIQRRNSEKAWEYLKDEFGLYMENVFGEVCLQYLVRENAAGKLPFFFQKAGRLWGSDPRAGSSGKELIALRDKTHGLFCGCLWKNEGKDADVLNSLIARAGEFRFARTWFMLFSKNPFSGSCKKLAARRKDVVLLTFKEMRSC